MGIMQPMKEHICLAHGEYFKHESDTSECPYCAEVHAKQIQKSEFKRASFNFIEVPVHCDQHGQSIVKTLESLAHKASCNHCRNDNLKEKVKKEKENKAITEFYAAKLPLNTFTTFSALLENAKSPKQYKITERFKKYVDQINLDKTTVNHANIFLTGNMGAGKTIMASALLQNIIRRSIECDSLDPNDIKTNGKLKCLFTTEAQLNTDIKATWRKDSDQTYKKLMNRLISIPLLCIDDVGSVAASESLFEAYTMILDERYNRNLPTILTSNVPYESLQNVIGARSKDRFGEKNRIIVINCDWEGYRAPSADEIEYF